MVSQPAPSPAAAIDAMVARLSVAGVEETPLAAAGGRVLAEPIAADRDSPACDVSSMDGYAARLSDLAAERLAVQGEQRIGQQPLPLVPGKVIKIVTGAPIPPGAELVIRREDVEESPGVFVLRRGTCDRLKPGMYIRRRAENAKAGEIIIEPGRTIDAAVLAALAAVGRTSVRVRRKLRIGVIVTGDEVVGIDQRPDDRQLRDSDGPAVIGLLGAKPWIDLAFQARVPDRAATIRGALDHALDACDAIILTGGVAMGDHDHAPAAIAATGATTHFHRVPQRPGAPILGAIGPDARPIFGLPGNPVSVLVTARRIVLPVLARAAGLAHSPPPPLVRLEPPPTDAIHLWWHRLVSLTAPGAAALMPTRGSGDITSAARSDGFVEIPPNQQGPGPWPFYSWGG